MRATVVTILSLLVVAVAAMVQARTYELTLLDPSTKALCNDGSPAGFYVSLNESSTEWIIHVQGEAELYESGSVEFCYDSVSCAARTTELVSSQTWPQTLQEQGGILSDNVKTNPDFFSLNRVIVKYCTSDLYTGTSSYKMPATGFVFLGSYVLPAVLNSVTQLKNFNKASRVLLSGQGAGGIGLGFKIDNYLSQIKSAAPQALTKFSMDASFFINIRPVIPGPLEYKILLEQGSDLWVTNYDNRCWDHVYDKTRPWQCLEYYYIADSLLLPQFSIENAQDYTSLSLLGCAQTPQTCAGLVWNITRSEMGFSGSVFIPSCQGHNVIDTPQFFNLKARSFTQEITISLYDAFVAWYDDKQKSQFISDTCYNINCNPTCAASGKNTVKRGQ